MPKGFGQANQSKSHKRMPDTMQELRRLDTTSRLDYLPDEDLKKALEQFIIYIDKHSTPLTDLDGETIDRGLFATDLPRSRYAELLIWYFEILVTHGEEKANDISQLDSLLLSLG